MRKGAIYALGRLGSGPEVLLILRNIAAGEYEDMGNVTTLADPAVVETLVKAHKEIADAN